MAEILIERSCQRFRKELAASDDSSFCSTSLDDVRHAIQQVDRQLAARQSCRNLSRLNPYLDAVERYSKAIDVLSNAVPCLPYIWAPLKFILTAVQDCSHALDKILGAYAEIGAALPRLSMLRDAFANDFDFQQLFAFLYEDILEFHTMAYKLIRKPAWKIFFLSSWGRFEHRFSALIDNIKANSNLIDQQAVTINILQTLEWRRKSLDDIISRERRQEAEQLQSVKNWLGATENDQDLKLEWLKSGCHPGTMHWITRNHKFRSWMQRGCGNPILWLFGKPGSGKSVLSSKIISFIQSNPKDPVLFFFCDYHTPVYGITAHVLRVFCAQIIKFIPELVQFFYDDYLSKNINPSGNALKVALSQILKNFDFVRIVVDGIDEVPSNEHKSLISELTNLTTSAGDICKLLICSQDLPSIRPSLRRRPALFLGDEKEAIDKDIEIIIKMELQDLQDSFSPDSRSHLAQERLEQMMQKIIGKAEGMFLWVRLVLSLLTSSGSLQELESNINSLPKELELVYNKILNNIKPRCVQTTLDRVKRIFEWLLVSKDQGHIRKHELLLGTSFCFGCESLDRSTLPLPNALEICKPLIEEGPGGTVGFVHSTVPQFLLDCSSGPFTTSLYAHQTIAYACISHLIQALDFAAETSDSEQPMMVKVGLGIYGLHAYANEHWIEHFLDYIAEANMDHLEYDVLVRQASRLAERHSQLSAVEPMALINQANDQSTEKFDNRLRSMRSIPSVHSLLVNILELRKQLESSQLMDQTGFQAVHHDITLFSFVEEQYHQTVQFLVTTNTYPGLSAADIQAFRADYGQNAWVCCFRSCRRSGVGFPSATELQNHRQRQHLAKLECYHPGCTYDVEFSSAKALHDHQRRAHSMPKLSRVPTSIRRKRRLSVASNEPDSQSDLLHYGVEKDFESDRRRTSFFDEDDSVLDDDPTVSPILPQRATQKMGFQLQRRRQHHEMRNDYMQNMWRRPQEQPMPPVPKVDRTMTDSYFDGLSSPPFTIPTVPPSQSAQIPVSPSNEVFAQRLHAANKQHLSTQSPVTSTPRDSSHLSQLAATSNSSIVTGGSTQTLHIPITGTQESAIVPSPSPQILTTSPPYSAPVRAPDQISQSSITKGVATRKHTSSLMPLLNDDPDWRQEQQELMDPEVARLIQTQFTKLYAFHLPNFVRKNSGPLHHASPDMIENFKKECMKTAKHEVLQSLPQRRQAHAVVIQQRQQKGTNTYLDNDTDDARATKRKATSL